MFFREDCIFVDIIYLFYEIIQKNYTFNVFCAKMVVTEIMITLQASWCLYSERSWYSSSVALKIYEDWLYFPLQGVSTIVIDASCRWNIKNCRSRGILSYKVKKRHFFGTCCSVKCKFGIFGSVKLPLWIGAVWSNFLSLDRSKWWT